MYIGLNLAEDRRAVGFFGYENEHHPPRSFSIAHKSEDFSSTWGIVSSSWMAAPER